MEHPHPNTNVSALFDTIAQVPVVVFAVDREGRLLVSEGAGLKALGLESGQLVGKTIQEMHGGNESLFEQSSRALTGESIRTISEIPLGSGTYWRTQWAPRRNAEGELDGAVGFAYDATDRVRTDEKLRAREHELHLILNHAPVILYRVDRHGVVTFSEGRGLAAIGLKPGQTVGLSIYDMYPEFIEVHNRVFAGEHFSRTEKVGSAWLLTEFTPVLDADGAVDGCVGVSIDVTAQVSSREEAERAVKHRDEFLSIVAHELRTPLAALSLSVANLLRLQETGGLQAAPAERVIRSLASAERQVRRIDALVDDLLDVSRIKGGRLTIERTPMRLDTLVLETADLFAEKASSMGCSLTVSASEPVIGDWDHARMEQVVTNLLSNALKYGNGNPVTVVLTATKESATLEVTDGGIGIAADKLGRIFEPFERGVSARNYGGLGLGLYIVHEVVTGHGGTVSVTSSVNQGSTFTVTLPLKV